MKVQFYILMLNVFFVFNGCGEKQKEVNSKEVVNVVEEKWSLREGYQKEIEKAVQQFYEAMVEPSPERLDSLCDKQLTYGHSLGNIQNKAEFIDDLVNGPYDFTSIETEGQTIYSHGNTAIVRHMFVAKAWNEGKETDIRLGCIQTYVRDDEGQWKLLARQGYKL